MTPSIVNSGPPAAEWWECERVTLRFVVDVSSKQCAMPIVSILTYPFRIRSAVPFRCCRFRWLAVHLRTHEKNRHPSYSNGRTDITATFWPLRHYGNGIRTEFLRNSYGGYGILFSNNGILLRKRQLGTDTQGWKLGISSAAIAQTLTENQLKRNRN